MTPELTECVGDAVLVQVRGVACDEVIGNATILVVRGEGRGREVRDLRAKRKERGKREGGIRIARTLELQTQCEHATRRARGPLTLNLAISGSIFARARKLGAGGRGVGRGENLGGGGSERLCGFLCKF